VNASATQGVRVSAGILIPWGELSFAFDRSSGPGGQNVNKVNTRVTLVIDLAASRVFSDEQRARLLARLGSRLDRSGRLRLVSQVHRSQVANRAEVIGRLVELLRAGLRPVKVRRPTRATAGSRKRRQTNKIRRSETKQGRSWRAGPSE